MSNNSNLTNSLNRSLNSSNKNIIYLYKILTFSEMNRLISTGVFKDNNDKIQLFETIEEIQSIVKESVLNDVMYIAVVDESKLLNLKCQIKFIEEDKYIECYYLSNSLLFSSVSYFIKYN
jgi:hypothetical protein